MITFAPFPIPVITPVGPGYVKYVTPSGMNENDEITVELCEGGDWLHFTTNQIKGWHNVTYGINKGKTVVTESKQIECLKRQWRDIDLVEFAAFYYERRKSSDELLATADLLKEFKEIKNPTF